MSFLQQHERLQSARSQHLLAAGVFLLLHCCCHHLPSQPLSLNVRVPEKAHRIMAQHASGRVSLGIKELREQ